MLLEQAIQLVTQSPENLAFHIVTLLALQAALALALWQWRRARNDRFAGRLAVAAGLIFLLRAGITVAAASLTASSALETMPPLERAADTATAVLLAWVLLPIWPQARFKDALLIFALLAIAAAYVVAAQDWPIKQSFGLAYVDTNQAAAWLLAQFVLVGGTLGLVALVRPRDWLLRWLTLLPLFAAYIAHWFQLGPGGLDPALAAVPYYVRLAYLVTFPLLAVIAQRHTLAELLTNTTTGEALHHLSRDLLRVVAPVSTTANPETLRTAAAKMTAEIMGAPFAAVVLITESKPLPLLQVTSWQKPTSKSASQSNNWLLKLTDWPAMQLAISQKQVAALHPNAVGARQLSALYSELGLSRLGPLLIAPMFDAAIPEPRPLGLLLAAAKPTSANWPEADHALLGSVAAYVGRVIAAAGVQEVTQRPRAEIEAELSEMMAARNAADSQLSIQSERLKSLQAALQENESRLQRTELVLEQTEARLAQAQDALGRSVPAEVKEELAASREATDALAAQLAAAHAEREAAEQRLETTRALVASERQQLEALQRELELTRQKVSAEQVNLLEAEVDTLRASLLEAEGAMAVAAAGEGGLNPEWVMLAITRYSGELEEAQRRIHQLEFLLDEKGTNAALSQMTMLAEQLRSPLAAISGYTDLLLAETNGSRPQKHVDLLQRTKSSTERMNQLLTQIVAMAGAQRSENKTAESEESVNVQEAIEVAVSASISALRDKDLQLDLNIDPALPPVQLPHDVIYQVVVHLLINACQASLPGGRVRLSAQMGGSQSETGVENVAFLRLVVMDSGIGIPAAERPFVFDTAYRAMHEAIPGLGDQGNRLLRVKALVSAHGGRLWVDSKDGQGSTFSVLLPLNSPKVDVKAVAATESKPA